jgi:hypothetical protein
MPAYNLPAAITDLESDVRTVPTGSDVRTVLSDDASRVRRNRSFLFSLLISMQTLGRSAYGSRLRAIPASCCFRVWLTLAWVTVLLSRRLELCVERLVLDSQSIRSLISDPALVCWNPWGVPGTLPISANVRFTPQCALFLYSREVGACLALARLRLFRCSGLMSFP